MYDSVILVVKTLNVRHTLLIYDNKSLASHNECDFVKSTNSRKKFSVFGSQMRGPRDG